MPVPPVLNNLAFCRFSQDDPGEAFEILQPNLAPEAHEPFAQALAAQISVALGRRAEAEESWRARFAVKLVFPRCAWPRMQQPNRGMSTVRL